MKILVAVFVVSLAGCGGIGGLNPEQTIACANAWRLCANKVNASGGDQAPADYGGDYDIEYADQEAPSGGSLPIVIIREGARYAKEANQQCYLEFTLNKCEMRIE